MQLISKTCLRGFHFYILFIGQLCEALENLNASKEMWIRIKQNLNFNVAQKYRKIKSEKVLDKTSKNIQDI